MTKNCKQVVQLRSPRQYAAIELLRRGRCTVRALMEHTGANGVPQLIASLRKKGFRIINHDLPGKDRFGRIVRYCEYELQPESFALADLLLAMEGNE